MKFACIKGSNDTDHTIGRWVIEGSGQDGRGAGPSVWGTVTCSFWQPYTIILTACLCGPSDDKELSYFALWETQAQYHNKTN